MTEQQSAKAGEATCAQDADGLPGQIIRDIRNGLKLVPWAKKTLPDFGQVTKVACREVDVSLPR